MLSEKIAEMYIRLELWGYPTLKRRFFDDVRPALVRAREDKRTHRKMEEQEGEALVHICTDLPHPTVDSENRDKDESASVTRQVPSSPSAFPVITSMPELPYVTEMDIHEESQARSVYQPSSPDRILLPTASDNREGLGPTSRDPTEQLERFENLPLGGCDVIERHDLHNVIEEMQDILSTSENTTEASRIAQIKEEAAE